MENIEDKINKELEKNNIHKKNYLWVFFTLFFTLIAIIYSYQTNTGIIAKQTIDKNLIAKNEESINSSENKKSSFFNILSKPEKKSNYYIDKLQESDNPPKIDSSLLPQEKELETKEELLAQEEAMQEEYFENIRIEKANEALEKKEELEKKRTKPVVVVKKSEEIPLKREIQASPVEEVEIVIKNVLPMEEKTPPSPSVIKEEKALTLKPIIPEVNLTQKEEVTEVKSEKIIPIKKDAVSEIQKVMEPKTNFNLTYCYSFEPAVSSFDKSCEANINDFINNNEKAIRYEIIGIIDLEDVKKLSNKGELNQALLAKNRIISVQNFIKEKISIPLSEHFYYLKSELPTRGFVLRAHF
ncbi:MAG: hypothetical protein WC141_07245 [Arcobacteraceae bacterium]